MPGFDPVTLHGGSIVLVQGVDPLGNCVWRSDDGTFPDPTYIVSVTTHLGHVKRFAMSAIIRCGGIVGFPSQARYSIQLSFACFEQVIGCDGIQTFEAVYLSDIIPSQSPPCPHEVIFEPQPCGGGVDRFETPLPITLEVTENCEPFENPGACCLSDGTCVEGLTGPECALAGGVEHYPGVQCALISCDNPCPEPQECEENCFDQYQISVAGYNYNFQGCSISVPPLTCTVTRESGCLWSNGSGGPIMQATVNCGSGPFQVGARIRTAQITCGTGGCPRWEVKMTVWVQEGQLNFCNAATWCKSSGECPNGTYQQVGGCAGGQPCVGCPGLVTVN